MNSKNYIFLILLPLIAFSIIFSKFYSQFDIINNAKDDNLDRKGEETVIIPNNGYPINYIPKKEIKEENIDIVSLTTKENEKIIPNIDASKLPGSRISIHPSIFNGRNNGMNAWIMNRPPHLVSSGHGQGY